MKNLCVKANAAIDPEKWKVGTGATTPEKWKIGTAAPTPGFYMKSRKCSSVPFANKLNLEKVTNF